MGKVINFQKADRAYPPADAISPPPSRAGRQFILALVRTPLIWLKQILLGLLAVIDPISNILGKLMIACMIFMTLIEWGNEWKHAAVLWIPATALVFCVIVHVTCRTILERYDT